MIKRAILAGAAVAAMLGTPVQAQDRGKGGTGVDEGTELPVCERPFGIAALVEEDQQAADPYAGLSPNMAALARMAAQQDGQLSPVDPMPLIKLMAARSNCFQLVERGAAQSALERERELAGIETKQVTADYLLSAQVVYSDQKARSSGGMLGGLGRALGGDLGGLALGSVGFKSKDAEAEVLLTLIKVRTGLQVAVASGSARKRDKKLFAGGILGSIGGAGGSYGSTDIGKVTAIAALDSYINLIDDARRNIQPPAPQPAVAPAPVTAAQEGSVTAVQAAVGADKGEGAVQ